jgi:F420-0:gamma-glutamyl ligase-like protein
VMSNYGYINLKHIEAKAEKICNCIGNGKYNTAKEMIIETAIAETGLGQIEDKTNGAGMGLTQFDKFPFDDIKKRNMRLRDKILKELGVDIALVEWDDLRYNDFLALLFTRLHYWLKGDPIPKTIEERARYWKLHYNTSAGKGTVEHYLEMNRKFGAL